MLIILSMSTKAKLCAHSASIVDSLEEESKDKDTHACIYLYFQDGDNRQPPATEILVNLVTQLLQQQERLSEDVTTLCKDKYRIWWQTSDFPEASDYEEMLKAEASSYEAVYLVLDALDNYHHKESREELLGIISRLPDNIKILITTRTGWLPGRDLNAQHIIRATPNRNDVDIYVRTRIQNDDVLRQKMAKVNSLTLDQIVADIMAASHGM